MNKIKLSDEQQETLSNALERIAEYIEDECYSVCDGETEEKDEQTLVAARKYVLDNLGWWLSPE